MDVDSNSDNNNNIGNRNGNDETAIAIGKSSPSIPLPALDIVEPEYASKIAALIEHSLAPLLAEASRAKELDNLTDQLSLYYQEKLHNCLSSSSASAALSSQHAHEQATNESLERLRGELDDIRSQFDASSATVSSLREENASLRERLVERDGVIAADAEELSRLRPHAQALTTLHSVEAERDTLRAALRRESDRRAQLDATHTAGTNALHAQVSSLTGELSSARAEVAAIRAAHDAAVNKLEGRVRDAERRDAEFMAERERMEAVVERLTKEVDETKTAATQLEDSFKTEVEHLEKLVKLHEGRVKEAEARAADCEEAVKHERDLSDLRASKLERLIATRQSLGNVHGMDADRHDENTSGRKQGNDGVNDKRDDVGAGLAIPNDLAPHVHTLLGDMEKALSARWELLERQKAEMDRARRTEMHALADRERLERDLGNMRAKADSARRDALRYSEQVDRQASEITRLENQVEEAHQALRAHVEYAARLGVQSPITGNNGTPLRLSSGARGVGGIGGAGVASTGRVSLPWLLPTQQQQLQTQQDKERTRQSSSPTRMQMQMPVDIGPASVIPTDMFASPESMMMIQQQQQHSRPSADFSMSLREMSEIRKRHELVLESLRDNRVSMG